MRITKYIASAAVAFAGICGTSCSSWLDYTPKDKQTYEQLFSTVSGFHTTVTGIYNQVTGSSLYGKNLSYGAIDILGLCYAVSSRNESVYEICSASFSGSHASSTFSSVWSSAYNAILNINLVLEALDEFPDTLDPDDAKLIKAEMLALRAYLHFDLVRIYGPVYSLNPSGLSVPFADSSEIKKRDRMPADQILTEKILPDVKTAMELLAEVDPVVKYGVRNESGEGSNWWNYRQLRFNYYATVLLAARIHMWMGNDQEALTEALKITGSPKVAEFFPWVVANDLLSNSINPDRMFSTECLFGFYRKDIENIFLGSFTGTIDPIYVLQPRNGYVSTLFSGNASSADYRRQSQWAVSSSAGGSDYDFIKYKSFTADKTTPEFWASFYGLMRISEAYYIAAEVYNNMGDRKTAGEYLTTVLKARGNGKIDTEFMTHGQVQDAVIMEYLREMRGEGQIFFLHKRHNQSFGSSQGGKPSFDASGYSVNNDTPEVSVRYNVPIPSGETY